MLLEVFRDWKLIAFQYRDQHFFCLCIGTWCARSSPIPTAGRRQDTIALNIILSGCPEIEEKILLYRIFLAERLIAVVEKRNLPRSHTSTEIPAGRVRMPVYIPHD